MIIVARAAMITAIAADAVTIMVIERTVAIIARPIMGGALEAEITAR